MGWIRVTCPTFGEVSSPRKSSVSLLELLLSTVPLSYLIGPDHCVSPEVSVLDLYPCFETLLSCHLVHSGYRLYSGPRRKGSRQQERYGERDV